MNKRDIWIDNVKSLACILVALGHFFQSMVKSGIIEKGFAYSWFNASIYYFHIPLFFICSGFLFQKYSEVRTLTQWKTNIIKKLIVFSVPYFTFSTITWVMKKVFSSSVNSQLNGLWEALFIKPTPPYWYLYTLLLIFVITWTAQKKSDLYSLLVVSLLCKCLAEAGLGTGIFAITSTMENWIWFVLGMLIADKMLPILKRSLSILLLLVFLNASVLIQLGILPLFTGLPFIMGLIASYSIISLIYHACDGKEQTVILGFLSKYTMPIFLMHTMFAAPVRIILLKVGIYNTLCHFVIGLTVTICAPIIAMAIMEKLKPLDLLL